MLDKKLFIELPGGNNNFHSAVLTSYAFSVHHFEFQVLKSLKRKWISSINVLADQRILDDVFGVVSGNVKSLSRYYSLSGIKSKGAFHPKINFLVGDTKLLVFFGSGNITPGGHGKNHELFTGFYADTLDSLQLPLLRELWQYLVNLSSNLEGYVKTRITKTVPSACTLLNNEPINKHQFVKLDNDIEVALVYNDESSIFDQLTTLIPKDKITEISVICPFYDQDGSTLVNVQEHFNGATVKAYVQKDFGLPPSDIKKHDNIYFYDWDDTERGSEKISSKVDFKRRLHGKIFLFKSEGIEYCMIGSANATIHALGGPNIMPMNEEFGSLYKLNGNGILRALGITEPKCKVSISKYKRVAANELTVNNESKQKNKVHIKSVDLSQSKMIVYLDSEVETINGNLVVYDQAGNQIISSIIIKQTGTSFNIDLPIEVMKRNPGYVLLTDILNNPISNKQAVNWLVDLENTDPTKSNRSLNQLLGNIENQTFNEFEIIEYINNIQNNRVLNANTTRQIIGTRNNHDDDNNNSVEFTYEEAVLIAKEKNNANQFLGSHSSTRLWESISAIFENKSVSIKEELMDEEEEGSAEVSRERTHQPTTDNKVIIKSTNEWNKKYKSLKRLSENYIATLKKLNCNTGYELNVVDFHQFLLATHLLTHVGALTKYEFCKDVEIDHQKIDYLFGEQMLGILTEFSKLCFRGKIKQHTDDIYLAEKMKYTVEKTISNAIFCLFLLDRKIRDNTNTLKDRTKLIGLNLFKYLMVPGAKFEEFVNVIANNYGNENFNPEMVLRFKVYLMNLFVNNNGKNDFFIMNHSGFCIAIENNGKMIKYKSLFNVNNISISDKNIIKNW